MKNRAQRLVSVVGTIVVISVAAWGQTPSPTPSPAPPPSSDIFVIDVSNHKGQMKFGEPVKDYRLGWL